MNIDFTNEVSTFNKDKFKILSPGEQFWDGLTSKEKAGKVLVVPKHKKFVNGNIDYQNYENLVIEKKDKHGKGIQGIQFCIAKDPEDITKGCDETYPYKNWITDTNGDLRISTNDLPLYNQVLIEAGLNSKNYKPQKIDLYVDPGNRFLGEVKGKDFITYDELLTQITGLSKKEIDEKTNKKELMYYEKKFGSYTTDRIYFGSKLNEGNDKTTGGNWLKIYDARTEKTLYIAKKPIVSTVSWKDLFKAGVVYGSDTLIKGVDYEYNSKDMNFDTTKDYWPNRYGTYKPCVVTKNGKKYLVRLLRGYNTRDGRINPNIFYDIDSNTEKNLSYGSEWNRYILPLVKDYRVGTYDYNAHVFAKENPIEKELSETEIIENNIPQTGYLGNKNDYKIQLARYNWFKDITLYEEKDSTYRECGQESWTQDLSLSLYKECKDGFCRSSRGSDDNYFGAGDASFETIVSSGFSKGFRPVLEEIN